MWRGQLLQACQGCDSASKLQDHSFLGRALWLQPFFLVVQLMHLDWLARQVLNSRRLLALVRCLVHLVRLVLFEVHYLALWEHPLLLVRLGPFPGAGYCFVECLGRIVALQWGCQRPSYFAIRWRYQKPLEIVWDCTTEIQTHSSAGSYHALCHAGTGLCIHFGLV